MRIPSWLAPFHLLCLPLIVFLVHAQTGQAEDPISLRERFSPGYQYHVSTRVELSGQLAMPADKKPTGGKTLAVSGESAIEYDERVLHAAADGTVQKTLRIYRRIDFQRKVGDQPQESTIRAPVRRLVVLRRNNVEVPFSPDGPLMWGEIDLVRTDVFTPALTGLFPKRPVQPGDSWNADTSAIQELTDMDRINDGRVDCRFEQITEVSGRRYARVSILGSVRG